MFRWMHRVGSCEEKISSIYTIDYHLYVQQLLHALVYRHRDAVMCHHTFIAHFGFLEFQTSLQIADPV
jgi:hypothetical protein